MVSALLSSGVGCRMSDIGGSGIQSHSLGGLYVTQKLETQNKKEDQISTPHPPDNAESEVFSDVRVAGVRFFEKI